MPDNLRAAFDRAMFEIYSRAKSEAGYTASRFFQMLQEYGGVETANRLILQQSDGFTELYMRRRLDLTVEHLILDGRWDSLFTDEQRQIARDRLVQAGATRP